MPIAYLSFAHCISAYLLICFVKWLDLMHLSAVLAHTMMVRREKRSVLSQLPEKTRQLVPIELAAKDLGAIRRRIAEMQKQGSEPGGESHDPMLGETYMMTGDAKVIGLDGFGWLLMASDGFLWLLMASDCCGLLLTAPDCFR